MRWLNNLNATPRLMGSFGVLLLLTLAMSSLGVYNLGQSNARLIAMYELDWAGSRQANVIAKNRLGIKIDSRDAVIHLQDPEFVAGNEKSAMAHIANIQAVLDATAKTYYSREAKAAVADLRSALPAY